MEDYLQVEILLVEDNPADAELTRRALRKRHLANKVVWLQDGAEALDFLFHSGAYAGLSPQSGPKLIFLDLKLPKVDGIEVLRRIKADTRTRLIPVVVMTSSHEERDLVESYQFGVNSYLVKPIDFERFVEVVSSAGYYWMLLNKTPP